MSSPYKNDYKLGKLGVNNNTRAIFDLMRTKMDQDNIVHLSVDQKLKLMAKTASKAAQPLDAFKTILIRLKKAGVIIRKSANAYMIDPDYGTRYTTNARKIHQQWVELKLKKRERQSRN